MSIVKKLKDMPVIKNLLNKTSNLDKGFKKLEKRVANIERNMVTTSGVSQTLSGEYTQPDGLPLSIFVNDNGGTIDVVSKVVATKPQLGQDCDGRIDGLNVTVYDTNRRTVYEKYFFDHDLSTGKADGFLSANFSIPQDNLIGGQAYSLDVFIYARYGWYWCWSVPGSAYGDSLGYFYSTKPS
jgi:hypothetical protein